jgi:hypothetical protein
VCAAIPRLLAHSGRFVIQTLHPGEPPEGEPDAGWREGSWSGFGREFSDPAPWYWRSVPAWERLLRVNGLEPGVVETPAYPDGTPASLLIVARPSAPSHD